MKVPIEFFQMKVFSLCSQYLFPLGETPQMFRLYLPLFKAALIKRTASRKAFKAVLRKRADVCWRGRAEPRTMKGAMGEGVMFGFINRARATFPTVHACGMQGAFANRRNGCRGTWREGVERRVVHVKVYLEQINTCLCIIEAIKTKN